MRQCQRAGTVHDVKYRLPIPSDCALSAVTPHASVWTPFAYTVESKLNTPNALVTPGYVDCGKSAVRSDLLVHPLGVPTPTPSMTTLTVANDVAPGDAR